MIVFVFCQIQQAINPVAVGKVRGKMQALKVGDYNETGISGDGVVCLQVHGDAGIAGQVIIVDGLQGHSWLVMID